jgi:hypothetical protein
MGILVNETYIDATRGGMIGESEVFESYHETPGEVFRSCQKEYGGCVSAVYVDTKDGGTQRVGWVFQKRIAYEDARTKEDTYIREVWVTLHPAKPTRTIEHHYADLG